MIGVTISVEVDSVVAAMQKHLNDWLNEKNELFLQKILAEAQKSAEREFGSAVTVSVQKENDNTYALVADGDAVCFLEFGTGVYAESFHEFAQFMPFDIYPGSWSESDMGSHTWSHWVNSLKNPMEYPYNRQARRGMWEAYKTIQRESERIAKEVYR